jgi:hypothetical protein
MRTFSRESILEKVALEGTNDLQIRCRPPGMTEEKVARIVGGWFWFNPSPFSELWARVPETKLSRRSDELKRKTYLGTQSVREKGFRLTYRLPDLIRLGCFHAAPLFLPSCAQTTRAHQQPTFSHHP